MPTKETIGYSFDWTHDRSHDWTHDWKHEWTHEWTHDWTHDCTHDWTHVVTRSRAWVRARCRYITNRLKEIKFERFAQMAKNGTMGDIGTKVPNLNLVGPPETQRPDGSAVRHADRAGFSS